MVNTLGAIMLGPEYILGIAIGPLLVCICDYLFVEKRYFRKKVIIPEINLIDHSIKVKQSWNFYTLDSK